MKKTWLGLIVVFIIAAAIYVMSAFNGLVGKDELVKMKFSELQATYQRRLDLLPNLVNVVQANAEFEQTVLQQVTEARALAMQVTQTSIPQGGDFAKLEAAQGALATATNRLLAVVEKYPNLKTTDAFLKLQTQIEGTERRIKVARKDFNTAVQAYNQSVRSVPTNLVAGMFGFAQKEGFQADAGASQPPEIKF
jgi:LemA protein